MTPAAYLDTQTDALSALLQKLVRIPTVNPPGENYERITSVLVDELEASGVKAKRWTVPASLAHSVLPPDQHDYPRYNVIGFLSAGGRKTVHFNAHYDVVPVSGKWRHDDPFSGEIDGGWIFGRGTGDMKGSMASLLFALRALRAARTPPLMNVEVSFTADEETDSALGSGWVVEHAPIEPDYAIVMEGGEREAVCCGHNGVVWLNVTVHGKAAHGSKPESGINALEKMSVLVLALEDYKRELARKTFRTPDGKAMVPTLNLGGVFSQGPGGKVNTVPALASFSIDRRVLATETVVNAERDLRAFLVSASRDIPDCRITIEKISENHPCYTAPTHPFFAAMAETVSRVRRTPAVFNVSSGFNDMHFFSHHLKIPTLGYGPGGENYHGVDEKTRVKDLLNTAKIYAEFLTTFAG